MDLHQRNRFLMVRRNSHRKVRMSTKKIGCIVVLGVFYDKLLKQLE